MRSFTADFETTTDENDCRVWAWATCDIHNHEDVYFGNSMETFIDWCIQENPKDVYFHNLKFDGNFILSYLLNNDYVYSEWKPKNYKEFKTVVSDTGVFYKIDVVFDRQGKKRIGTIFKDSLKKLPFSVEVIAKAFGLDIEKLSIDYHTKREVGHVLTDEEIAYIRNDVQITAQALNTQFANNMKKLTVGSDALNDYKQRFGASNFERTYPVLPSEVDSDLRQAYKGGYVYVNESYRNVIVKKGLVYDVNSMYPHIMKQMLLPFGLPIYYDGKYNHDDTHPLYVQRLKVSFTVKKGYLPTIQLKGNSRFIDTEYIKDSKGIEDLVLSSVDLKLFLEHYDIHYIEYVGGYKFQATTGLFDNYIDYWYDVKATSDGALKTLAKLMLNSLYGKFGTNPNADMKRPYLSEEGIVKWEREYNEDKPTVYIPMALFITSYARDLIVRSAQSNIERFCYCDTDSLHFSGLDSVDLDIDSKRLGAWKLEGVFRRARYIRAKTYAEEMIYHINITNINVVPKLYTLIRKDFAGVICPYESVSVKKECIHLDIKCAGMPQRVKRLVTFDTFKEGLRLNGKLKPKTVKGGIILIDEEFTLKHNKNMLI